MKLSGRDFRRLIARPDPDLPGLLIYGEDAMRVALLRQDFVKARIGPEGEAEMRLVRLSAADLRKSPGALRDELKAVGFFPGPRVVLVEDAGDAVTEAATLALDDWQSGDATLVMTAGILAARSKLRGLFEKHGQALSMGVYNDPPSRDDVADMVTRAGLPQLERAAEQDLMALAQALDPGDLRQVIDKLGIYKLGDATPVTAADLDAVAPRSVEGALDDLLHAVAEGRLDQVTLLFNRIKAQGVGAVTLCIAATRHFRALYAAQADPAGPASALSKLRPPVFGPNRQKMIEQARHWRGRRVETALSLILETDLALRSASRAPDLALMERALIRLTMLGRKTGR